MRQYHIDELRPEDYESLKGYLDEHYGPSQMEGIYWIPIDDDLLDKVQSAHKDCHPLCFAVELKQQAISFELLLRTRNKVRCDCIRYANATQTQSIIQFGDNIFETLKILS